MSIAEREAENAGPEYAFQRLRLDMDDVRDAYISGRTAEPCKEQVEAALAAMDRHKFYHTDNGVDAVCRCGAVIEKAWPHERPMIRHQVSMMLEAARKAVM